MSRWLWSAQVGLVLGVIAFVLAFVPILILQYRRFGVMSPMRMLGAAASAIYVVAIASYTWLPLPDLSPEWCALYGIDTIQRHPFAFVDDVRSVVADIGIRQTLRSAVLLQVVFNIVLFVPWGVIVLRYFQRGFLFTVVSGFMASLFVEVTQATGLWGVYDCAYRLADVDDLIMNTLGALIGAVIAPVLLFWMPRTEKLESQRGHARPISSMRRYASMLITLAVTVTATFVGIVVMRMGLLVLNQPLESRTERVLEHVIVTGVVLLTFYLPAMAGYGNIGMLVVWIAPRWRAVNGELVHGSMLQRVLRASVIGAPYLISQLGTVPLVNALLLMAVVLSIVTVSFTRQHRAFSGIVARAELVDIREDTGPVTMTRRP